MSGWRLLQRSTIRLTCTRLSIPCQLNNNEFHYRSLREKYYNDKEFDEYVNMIIWKDSPMETLTETCAVCLSSFSSVSHRPVLCSAKASCGNSICEKCFKALLQRPHAKCPMCRASLDDTIIYNIAC
eukprot:GHVR01108450.1.p1 GENE.GHVR01108450.1~~GHVR01108450.1.p1  ORF type:complete len:127 (+),score=11.05 GHVR01108450.1:189-569(+)